MSQLKKIHNFTNHNIPGCVDQPCFTCFYENTVSTKLLLENGEYAPIEEWDLTGTIPGIKCHKKNINYDNLIKIIKVTKIPSNKDEEEKLVYAVLNARHLNIRLIIPKYYYPVNIRTFIDNP